MAASQDLLTYLHELGMSDAQIQSLLTSMGGTDGPLNENDVRSAAARYAAALAAGTLVPPSSPSTTTPGGTTPGGTTPGGSTPGGGAPIAFDPSGLPVSPLASNPAAAPQEMTAYWQQVAADLIAGKYTPYQMAASGRGQDPNNKPGPLDASPEATLSGQQYAGTVAASALSPELAAGIKYNTPQFAAGLAAQAQSAPDSVGLTANNLGNAYAFNAYAGNPQDLAAAYQTAQQADYAGWLARFGLTPETAATRPGMSYADYTRGMPVHTVGNTLPGQAPSLQPMQGGAFAQYGPAPIPTTPGPAGAMGYFPPPGTPMGSVPSGPGGTFTTGPGGAPPPAPPTAAPAAASGPTASQQAALPKIQGYMTELSGVKNPTQKQKDDLAMYQDRYRTYGGVLPSGSSVRV